MRRGDRLLGGALLVATALLSGCTDDGNAGEPTGAATATTGPAPAASPSSPAGPEDGPWAGASYVALGDSFTAAPYVPVTDFADGCLRSSGNYPSLLAGSLGAELTDVSCSGAESADLTGRQPVGLGEGTVPPQLDAVPPDADLVTVGIGGNDQNLFGTLVFLCTSLADQPGTPCADRLETQLGDPAETAAETGRSVAAALREVRRAAPEARIVLVGYPRIVPAADRCTDMPLAVGDRPRLVEVEQELNEALAGAAEEAGVEFLDLRGLSSGHEICSADPWVNGRLTDESRALAYHPFAQGQRAVAEALETLLEEGD